MEIARSLGSLPIRSRIRRASSGAVRASPVFRFRVAERRAGHAAEMQPVRLVAAILAPRHFVCVLVEVPPANPVMDAVFGAAKAAKPALRIVGASALIALEFARVIDP